MRPRLALLLITACVALAPASAAAGNIRGTLWVSGKVAMHARAVASATPETRAATKRAQRGVTDAVVWVETVPDKVERKLAGGSPRWFWQHEEQPRLPRIVQRGHAFAPRTLAVAAGSQVEFLNLDRVYHNAFSVSSARRFDLGKYPPGRADTVLFEHPGVINLHCDIHPEELGFVVVVPNHVIGRPDSTGAFTLPKLPPGTYALRAWHPRLGELKRSFEVPKRGDVNLELSF
jgi:hypothetical protein